MLALALLVAAAIPYVPIYEAIPPKSVLKQPAAEFRQIAWMVGRWRCHAYSFAVGSHAGHDYGQTTYTAKLVMQNPLTHERVWLQLEDAAQRDLSFITFDPMARHWVLSGIEWPVAYGTQTGTMSGNRLTFSGSVTVFGRAYRLRSTYTKRGNDAFSILNEEQLPNGTWLRDDEYDFVRNP